jgi:hypothetical protein
LRGYRLDEAAVNSGDAPSGPTEVHPQEKHTHEQIRKH